MSIDSELAIKLTASHMADIRRLFATLLAESLGRSKEEVAEGLEAGDFSSRQSVQVSHPDGSTMRLRNAFVVRDPKSGAIGVFSEHMGYYLFKDPGGDLDVLVCSEDDTDDAAG